MPKDPHLKALEDIGKEIKSISKDVKDIKKRSDPPDNLREPQRHPAGEDV
ncbi:hypothetical protein [Alkalicoccus chagannorensis]|nr:hypothetical protein [Alkalicoccus chagannorensis]